jgi:glutathione S-transferase
VPPTLYAHPFSSYCQKVLIALYENETPFTFRMLDRNVSLLRNGGHL